MRRTSKTHASGRFTKKFQFSRSENFLTQTELSEKTGIPILIISRIESGKTTTVGHDVLAKLALFFNVSADYLLGLTDVRMRKNVELGELGLSNQALFQILSDKVNSQILSMMIESRNFPRFLDYAQTYEDYILRSVYDQAA